MYTDLLYSVSIRETPMLNLFSNRQTQKYTDLFYSVLVRDTPMLIFLATDKHGYTRIYFILC